MRIQRVPRDLGIGEVAQLLAKESMTAAGHKERIAVICGSGVEDHLREVSSHVIFLNPSNRVTAEDLETKVGRIGADRLVVCA